MRALMAAVAALGGFSFALVLAGIAPTSISRKRGVAIEAVIIGSAGACLLVRSAPTGSPVADLVWAAGFGALISWAAIRASHRAVAITAVGVCVVLGLAPLAAAGAGVSIAIVALRQRVPPLKGIAGGFLATGLLTEVGPRGGSWPEALAMALLVGLAAVGARRASPRAFRFFSLGLGAVFAYVALAAAGFLLGAVPAFGDLDRGVRLSKSAAAAIGSADQDSASSLGLAASAFRSAEADLDSAPAHLVDLIPGVAQNAAALRALASAGADVAEAAAGAAGAADLQLSEGRVDLSAVRTAGQKVRRARTALVGAGERVDGTRSPSLVPPVADAVAELGGRLDQARPAVEDLDAALEQLPALLGGTGARRYLLALQTPAELRASGGIIGSYAILEADQGALELSRAGSVEELNVARNPAGRQVEGAEEYLGRYGQFQPLQTWQNLTLSPDWPTVGSVAAQLLPQSGGPPVDGVISLDPFALAEVLEVVGPLEVGPWPEPISAERAVPVLLHEQYLRFPNPERREFLADVTAAVFDRLTRGGAPLRRLGPALAEAARRDSLMVWLEEAGEQRLAERLELAGRFLPDDAGDSLAVVNQNSSGNKIDWFLRRMTSYAVRFDPGLGRAEATLRIELTNEAPAQGLPPYVIGGAGPAASRTAPGENRSLFSVYSPMDLIDATLDGAPLQMDSAEELGRRVHSSFVTIAPGATVVIELLLGGPIDPVGGAYRLAVDHQVLAQPETFRASLQLPDGWTVGDSTARELVVERDRVLNFRYERTP